MLARSVRVVPSSIGCIRQARAVGGAENVAKRCAGVRTLLSEAYYCNQLWDERKLLPSPESAQRQAQTIEHKFAKQEAVDSLALDQFINSIDGEEMLALGEKFLENFRKSSAAIYLRDSTVHSWVRQCIDWGRPDLAIQTLRDRRRWGLFADNLAFNLLLDTLLVAGDEMNALETALEMMRQEVLTPDQPLSQLLALYVCHRYRERHQEQRASDGDDDAAAAGMTRQFKKDLGLAFSDSTRGMRHLVANSYHLLGLVMEERYQKAVAFLESLSQQQQQQQGHSPAVVVEEVLEEVQRELEQAQAEKPWEQRERPWYSKFYEDDPEGSESDPTYINSVHGPIYHVEFKHLEKVDQVLIDSFKGTVGSLRDGGLVSSEKLADITVPYVTSSLSQNERGDIENYRVQLDKWFNENKETLFQIKKLQLETKKKELQAMKTWSALQQQQLMAEQNSEVESESSV